MKDQIMVGRDTLVYLEGPVDESTDPPVVIATGTVTAKLYDDGADTQLRVDEASGSTVIDLDFVDNFEVGDTVLIELDDGTFQSVTVTIVAPASSNITVTPGLTDDAAMGNRAIRKVGPDVTLTAYGTPVIRKPGWGFKGSILAGHAGIKRGMTIRVEIEYAEGAGLEVFRAAVVGPF